MTSFGSVMKTWATKCTMQRAMAGAALAGQWWAHARIAMRKMTPSSSRTKESALMSSMSVDVVGSAVTGKTSSSAMATSRPWGEDLDREPVHGVVVAERRPPARSRM
ncbi:hypothetical protein ACQEVX_35840 [Streptomyces syringium]|uniref:hypothetical protein n=1 Tax=Streptomyces syringium TaxID=76729 RepID=UPI003D90278F